MWIHYETNRLLSLCIWAQYIAHSTWLALCALFSAKGFLRAQGTVGQERRITWVWMWHCSHRVCILMYIYHILMYTIMKDKQWVCTFADHRVTATCYTCSYYCYCECYCLYRDHHRGWAAILSGDQLTAGVQAGQSSCSQWWSGCNATTPATSQMFLDFYRVYWCFSLRREKG